MNKIKAKTELSAAAELCPRTSQADVACACGVTAMLVATLGSKRELNIFVYRSGFNECSQNSCTPG